MDYCAACGMRRPPGVHLCTLDVLEYLRPAPRAAAAPEPAPGMGGPTLDAEPS